MTEALISADIPLSKLQNAEFRSFLEKYTKKSIPDESTLRKNYVDQVFQQTKNAIRKTIGDDLIYFQVDETTDACGRYIANLLIGSLNSEKCGKSFLISTKVLEKTNNNTITRFIHEGLTNFFLPEALPVEKIILMLSDAAAYMCKAANNLQIFFPQLIHTTCLAHGLNRLAEEIRNQFPIVNDLINNIKKKILKAPLRVQFYREKFPELPLPPQPVVTRWGTWLNAVTFYTENYQAIKDFVCQLSDDANSIKETKKLFSNKQLPSQLAFISANYCIIAEAILQLENKELELVQSTKLIDNCFEKLSAVNGVGKIIFDKFKYVLDKNKGFKTLSLASKILGGEFVEINLEPHIIPNLKFAPITSVDVERSFSIYKHILSDRRQSFQLCNLEKHLIINWFNKNK